MTAAKVSPVRCLPRPRRPASPCIIRRERSRSIERRWPDRRRNGAAAGVKSWRSSGAAVVLAAGGFEANAEWRTRYLGPGFELAKVRGTRFNTGDGLRMALDAGAMPHGHWSGCHSASWDLNAPDVNELAYGTVFKRDDYLYGIMVNARGERFVDEGSDVRSVTYAKLGRVILASARPGRLASLRRQGFLFAARGIPPSPLRALSRRYARGTRRQNGRNRQSRVPENSRRIQ